MIILIYIQLKNLGVRFRPLGRRKEDLLNSKKGLLKYEDRESEFHRNWFYSKNMFDIKYENSYSIWKIGVFHSNKIHLKSNLHLVGGRYWYLFSTSKLKTEKIMAPLFRKILNKYKKFFESEKSIEFIIENQEENHLYTWLKNETHTHTAIYSFLDECVFIAQKLQLTPRLFVTLSDEVTFQVWMPKNETLLKFETEFKNLYAVDFTKDKDFIKITLWVAFSPHKIPTICIDSYSQAKILAEERKAS